MTLNEHANHQQALSKWHCCIFSRRPHQPSFAFVHQLIRNTANRLMFSLSCLHCEETPHPPFKQSVSDLTLVVKHWRCVYPAEILHSWANSREEPAHAHKHSFLKCHKSHMSVEIFWLNMKLLSSANQKNKISKVSLICSASGATKTWALALRCAGPSVAVSEPFRSYHR